MPLGPFFQVSCIPPSARLSPTFTAFLVFRMISVPLHIQLGLPDVNRIGIPKVDWLILYRLLRGASIGYNESRRVIRQGG